MRTIDVNSLSHKQVHQYLLSAVAPRPICFASTIDKKGNVNLSPFSFFNVFSSNPPIMIFSPARSGRDNSTKHTYDNVLEVPEVVINIVNFNMVEQMSLASTAYAKGLNEFTKAGFTELESNLVKPPRVAQAPISFECLVNDVISLGKEAGAGNLVICEVKIIHIQEAYLNNEDMPDTTKLDLVGRMGTNWYCRASQAALFEIKKPKGRIAIGFDQLPEHILISQVLTGNDIAKLAGLEKLPTAEDIKIFLNNEDHQQILLSSGTLERHVVAKEWIIEGKIEEALLLLLQ